MFNFNYYLLMKPIINFRLRLLGIVSVWLYVIYYIQLKLMYAGSNIFYDVGVPVLTTVQAITTGTIKTRVDIDYGMDITKDRETVNILTWLLRNLRTKKAATSYVRQFVQRSLPRWIYTSGAVAGGASVTIQLKNIGVVSGANAITPSQQLTLTGISLAGGQTNDVIVYSNDGTSVVIKPNDPAYTIPNIPDNTAIYIRGTSFAQGTASAMPVLNIPEYVQNVQQIFKNDLRVAKTVANERLYGGESERDRLRQEKERDHAEDLEDAFLFNGKLYLKESSSTDGVHRGTLEGMEYTVLANSGNTYAYSNWDLTDFKAFIMRMFLPRRVDGNQKKRIALCNSAAISIFWELNQNKLVTFSDTKIFGQEVTTARFATGMIDLILHPKIDQRYNDPNKPYMLFTHPRYMEERPMRDTRLEAAIQAPNLDAYEDQYLTETTILLTLAEMFGVCIPN